MDRRAFSIDEFGRTYGLGRSLTYTLLKEGKLQGVKVGRKRLIPADAAEAWLAGLSEPQAEQAA
jgi:excisionase family DNA binding protein